MTNHTIFEFDGLDEPKKELILKICKSKHGRHVKKITLAALDKGLSGSLVLLAQWEVREDSLSKYFVFKIGNAGKLKKEYDAIKKIVAPMIEQLGDVDFEKSDDGKIGILSQEFIGWNGTNISLKQYIEDAGKNHKDVSTIIDRIYEEKLSQFYRTGKKMAPLIKTKTTLSKELQRYLKKGNLMKSATQIGKGSLEKSLKLHFKMDLKRMKTLISKIRNKPIEIRKGPVHGDLHSQNIVLDSQDTIGLIDFGWTNINRWRAVDFICLECSLKFLVCTPFAKLEDLIRMEKTLNDYWGKEDKINYKKMEKLIHGKELAKIMSGIASIRKKVRQMGVVKDLHEYQMGLVMLSFGITTLPKLNRLFLFHSIANNLNHTQFYV